VRRRTTFAKQYPDLTSRVRAGIALIHEVADLNSWHAWATDDSLDKKKSAEFSAIRNDQLAGLSDYAIPAVRLERTIGFDALAKIFETINRTGIRLATFDLMVARLYPRDFDLRMKWTEAEEKHASFGRFDVDGMEILRLIALRQYLQGSKLVKGIRQGDVLQLPASEVKEHWDWAVEAYAAVLDFVRSRCGVVSSELLPAVTMLLPIAAALKIPAPDSAEDPGEGSRADLAERFFWSAGLAQTYSQGANTQAVRDARELVNALFGTETPDVIERVEVDIGALSDDRRRNESMLRTAMALLIHEGARDWQTGEVLRESENGVVLMRIFPSTWLRSRGMSADALINWSVQSPETAKALRSSLAPSEHMEVGGWNASAISTQSVDPVPLVSDDWGTLAEERSRALRDRLEQLVSRLRAD
jgi:hypothetical protein